MTVNPYQASTDQREDEDSHPVLPELEQRALSDMIAGMIELSFIVVAPMFAILLARAAERIMLSGWLLLGVLTLILIVWLFSIRQARGIS